MREIKENNSENISERLQIFLDTIEEIGRCCEKFPLISQNYLNDFTEFVRVTYDFHIEIYEKYAKLEKILHGKKV